MTDIEALRARVRELAVAVENAGDDLGLFSERHGEFQRLASPANVKALDAEITRLREDLDRVTRERDEAREMYAREGRRAMIAEERASAAEAALAKRDEEVARLKAELTRVKPDRRAMAQAVADAQNVEMLPVVRIERHEVPTLTKEPTNAECKQDAGESIATAIRARGET